MDKKQLVLIGGVGAGLLAVLFFASRGRVYFPDNTVSGAVSDQQNNANDAGPGGFSPGYTGYNFGPLVPQGLPITPEETPAGAAGSNSCCSMGCAGMSAGDTSTANLGQFLDYMRQTNPNYVALQAVQLQSYAALFAKGSQYKDGSTIREATGVFQA